MTRLGNLLDFGQLFNLSKSPIFLGNFCKGDTIYHFSSEINFRQLLQTFGDFYLVTLVGMQHERLRITLRPPCGQRDRKRCQQQRRQTQCDRKCQRVGLFLTQS